MLFTILPASVFALAVYLERRKRYLAEIESLRVSIIVRQMADERARLTRLADLDWPLR